MITSSLPFSNTVTDARRALTSAYETLRTQVRRIGDTALHNLDRAGNAVERYAATKIERRVKPPIVVALVAASVAVIVAVIAAFRR
jgi:hypothetical protein